MPDTDTVERVRMTLAEAGYPDVDLSWNDGAEAVDCHSELPPGVCWKVGVVCGSYRLPCRSCYLRTHGRITDAWERCLAIDEGIGDCGVERSVL